MVCEASLVVAPDVVMDTVGDCCALSINVTGLLVPRLPAASVSSATMLFEPGVRVTVVDHDPLLSVAVPISAPLS